MVVELAAAGIAAGAAGRVLLVRLPRGAELAPGWCELVTALLWAIIGLAGVPAWWLPVMLAFSWLAVLLTATDLLHNRLPNALTLPAYPLFAALLIIAAAAGPGQEILIGAAVGSVLFWSLHAAVRSLAPHAMGGGDVKLSGTLGAILGAVSWLALTGALVLASVLTLGLRAISRGRWKERVPHGPGLLAATWLLALLPGQVR